MHTISDYEYNYLGYLTKETISMANANEYKYSFDGNGNITSVLKNNATYKTFQYTNPLNKTQLTKFNNKTIDYDSYYQGNPIKYGTTINGTFTGIRFSYEGRKLVSYIDNSLVDPKTITYTYGYDGVRTTKIVNGVTTYYFYEGSRLILEKTNNITKEYSYDSSGLLYSLRYYNGSIYQNYYYVYNASGLIIGLTNELGELVINYAYDAYGNILSTSGDDNHINSILYKGYYLDYETNLYYCLTRYYVPSWYRWLNADDVSYLDNGSLSGLNLFLYCNNNPVMYSDPSGTDWWSNFWNSVGKWFGDTFGFNVNAGVEVGEETYNFWWSKEYGVGYSKSFGNGKIFNFYINIPAEPWKLWEYSYGFDININGYGFGIYFGPESGISIHTPKVSYDYSANSRGQFTFKESWLDDKGIYNYKKISINTGEIIATLKAASILAIPFLLFPELTIPFSMVTATIAITIVAN